MENVIFIGQSSPKPIINPIVVLPIDENDIKSDTSYSMDSEDCISIKSNKKPMSDNESEPKNVYGKFCNSNCPKWMKTIQMIVIHEKLTKKKWVFSRITLEMDQFLKTVKKNRKITAHLNGTKKKKTKVMVVFLKMLLALCMVQIKMWAQLNRIKKNSVYATNTDVVVYQYDATSVFFSIFLSNPVSGLILSFFLFSLL